MADTKKASPKLIYESQASLYDKAVKKMNADKLIVQHKFKMENYLEAAEMLEQIVDYKDAAALAKKCRELAEQTKKDEKEYRYQLALEQREMAKSAKGYEKAEKMLNQVKGYKDADQLIVECKEQRIRLEKKAKRKTIGKLCALVVLIGAVAAFFVSPAWDSLKQQIIERNTETTEVVTESPETELSQSETEAAE